MELLQLRYFCDAAQNENFSATAKKYGVPTSAVSQSIHRLEKELGTSFFSRQANSIKLNNAGKEFYSKISSSLALMDDAVSSVSKSKQKRTLSIFIDAKRRHMLRIIEEFKKLYTDIDVNINHNPTAVKNDFDIIIADYDIKLPRYEKHLIISEDLAIAIHNTNPLSTHKNLTVDMLKNEPFITMNEQRPMHKTIMNVCKDFGFVPHITLQSDDPSYVSRLVSLGMGVAIGPAPSSETYSENVVFYPIKGYTRDIYAYVLQSKQVLPYINDFLTLLTKI
ncbi:MAG: LysR family transcriptional regulator [Clostridia bacterium]|nr:LysR family transcriptional regulator [Clostridia bacterium]